MVPGGWCMVGGCMVLGGWCMVGDAWSRGGGGIPACTEANPPPVNRMTDRCKNITLSQTSFAGGKNCLETNKVPLRVTNNKGRTYEIHDSSRVGNDWDTELYVTQKHLYKCQSFLCGTCPCRIHITNPVQTESKELLAHVLKYPCTA